MERPSYCRGLDDHESDVGERDACIAFPLSNFIIT